MILQGLVEYIRGLVLASPTATATPLAHAQGLGPLGCHLVLQDGHSFEYFYFFNPEYSMASTVLAVESMLQNIGRSGDHIHFPQPIVGQRVLVTLNGV